MDRTQENDKCRLWDDRDETVNHVNEYSKLAQKKYKSTHEWMEKMNHWELCKVQKFNYTDKWYVPKQENKAHEILWSPDMETDHPVRISRLTWW